MFWGIDTTYFWYVFIPTMLLSVGVQIWLKRTYSKWHKVQNSADLTGKQVTNVLFDDTSLNPIPVHHIRGNLTDHYDPGKNEVNLSDAVYDEDSVAAMAVAAHELGHVQQYQTGSTLIKMRGLLVPAVTLSPTVSYVCLLLGLLFNMTNLLKGSKAVLRAAAMTYLAAAVSSVITLFYYFGRVRQEARRDKAREEQRAARQKQVQRTQKKSKSSKRTKR
ncbi:MAG: zinc metallopeptidase [Chloroflexota bacterium]